MTATENPYDPYAPPSAEALANGLRGLADWIVRHPEDAPIWELKKPLLALHTNQAVHEFASKYGLAVRYEDGNASTDLQFGAVTLHAYGYADFGRTCDEVDTQKAQSYADRHGLSLVPASGAAGGRRRRRRVDEQR